MKKRLRTVLCRLYYHRNSTVYATSILGLIFCIVILIQLSKNLKIDTGRVTDTRSWLRASRNLSDFVRLDNNTHIVSAVQPHRCNGNTKTDFVIYFVTTIPGHREQRRAIRNSWGKYIRPKPIFVMGKSDDEYEMDRINTEAQLYQDIIIENFVDSYERLTIKTGFILKHYLRLCPTARYLMKVDDDMFVNPTVIDSILSDKRGMSLIGRRYESYKPHRDPESKWYLPNWLYADQKLPPYISGTGYLIPGNLVNKIYLAAIKIPIINLEDVFFTGIVAYKTLNISLENDRHFTDKKPLLKWDYCLYKNLATAHEINPSLLLRIWQNLKDNQSECTGFIPELINYFFGLI